MSPIEHSAALAATHRARRATARFWFAIVAMIGLLAFFTWASDFVTPQGERTIYTVSCAGGAWQGKHCTGRLVASERYRFRALQAHREVLFWTIGANEASSKFTECNIDGGRDWTCKPNADASKSITLQMLHGNAVHDDTGRVRSFRAVPKWRWILASYGLPAGADSDL